MMDLMPNLFVQSKKHFRINKWREFMFYLFCFYVQLYFCRKWRAVFACLCCFYTTKCNLFKKKTDLWLRVSCTAVLFLVQIAIELKFSIKNSWLHDEISSLAKCYRAVPNTYHLKDLGSVYQCVPSMTSV